MLTRIDVVGVESDGELGRGTPAGELCKREHVKTKYVYESLGILTNCCGVDPR